MKLFAVVKQLLIRALLGASLIVPMIAQQQPIPETTTYEDHGPYAINLQNLSLVLKTQLRTKAGLIPFDANGSGAFGINVGGSGVTGHYLYPNVGSISTTVRGLGTKVGFVRGSAVHCPDNSLTYFYTQWTVTTPDGNVHSTFPVAGSSSYVDEKLDGTSCYFSTMTLATTDGSHLTAIINTPSSVVIYNNAGERLTGGWGLMTTAYDANGNSMSVSGSTYTDSLGFTALSGSGNTYSWTDVNGGTQQISVSTTSKTPYTTYGCASPALDYTASGVNNYVSGISYPNGTSLGVTWEQTPGKTSAYTTGRIAGLTLPTGGAVSFTYTGFQCAYLEPVTLKRITSDGTWTYTWAPVLQGTTPVGNTTTVVDPAGNTTVYTFNAAVANDGSNYTADSALPLLISKVTKQGASTVLTTTTFCYDGATDCTQRLYGYITQVDEYTTLAGMSTSSRKQKIFDSTGNLLSSSSYDFGSGTPTFVTTIAYGTWTGTTCVPIGGSGYITNRPCQTITKDSAGNILSESRKIYDILGNNTNVYARTGTSAWLYSSATYNTNGTVATSTTPSGVVTHFSYGSCNSAFPTQVTVNAISNYSSWNCDGGVKTSDTDANGAVTSYGYTDSSGIADPFWRVSYVTDALNNTNYTIYGPNTVEKKFSFLSSVQDMIATVDGYGRPVRSQTKLGSGYQTITTKYNPAASSVSTSVPCLVPLGSDCTTGFTTVTVDGASRTSSAVDGAGGTSTSTFFKQDGTLVLSPAPTGEHNKTATIETDGLGRTLSSCAILTSGGSPCGQASGGSGILTTTAYTTAASTSTITVTRGAESKVTVSDAIGRVITHTTPELGMVTNYYDVQAACPGSIAGHLTRTTDANGNSVCYYYDAYGRLSTINANGNNCKLFYYDTSNGFTGVKPTGIAPINTKGRMISASTSNCSTTLITDEWFSYDSRGNLTDKWQISPHSGGYYHTSATYAPNGTVSGLSGIPGYTSGITYSLDADGHVTSATHGTLTPLVSSVVYGPLGPTQINIGTSTDKDTYQYDSNTGRMTQYSFTVGPYNDQGALIWNTNGSLATLAITDGLSLGGSHTCGFVYDDVSRLISDNCGTAWSQTFSYDQYNNLTKAGSSTWNPGYNTKNQYSGIGASYDNNGNITNDVTWNHYTWDAFNKMITAGSSPVCGTSGTCITYDASGAAIEESVGAVYTEIVYSPIGKTAVASGLSSTLESFIPLPGGGTAHLIGALGNSTPRYDHKDWLGTVRVSSFIQASTVAYDRAFAPYGEEYLKFGTNYSPNFTGDTADLVPSLLDTPNRELSSGQGRWLSPDPAGASWNAYAYSTDPNTHTDPTGLANWPGEGKFIGRINSLSISTIANEFYEIYSPYLDNRTDPDMAAAQQMAREQLSPGGVFYTPTHDSRVWWFWIDLPQVDEVDMLRLTYMGMMNALNGSCGKPMPAFNGAKLSCAMVSEEPEGAMVDLGISFQGQGEVTAPTQLELPFMSQVEAMTDRASQMLPGTYTGATNPVSVGGTPGFEGPYLATSQSDGAAAIGNYLEGGTQGLVVNQTPVPLPVQMEFDFTSKSIFMIDGSPYEPWNF